MYVVDDRDRVVELSDLPRCDVGAPCPVVLCAEYLLTVAYFLGSDPTADLATVVRFDRPYAHAFGPPNDEAFSGHPLAERGPRPYGAFEVLSSSWVRALERMNSVHRYHRTEQFTPLRHFVLSFHDSTFECVAIGYSHQLGRGQLGMMIARETARITE